MSTAPEPGDPSRPERDWDAEFREITAHLTVGPPPQDLPVPRVESTPPVADMGDGEDAAEDFVPPEPTPLDAEDPALIIMIGAFVVGPLWLIYLTLFDREAETLWWVMAGLLLALGLVLAVLRQPKSRDEDDPDDGARL